MAHESDGVTRAGESEDQLLREWLCAPAAMLREIRRRERELGIAPDADLDGYLKANAMAGQRSNAGTLLIMRLLGLEVRLQLLPGLPWTWHEEPALFYSHECSFCAACARCSERVQQGWQARHENVEVCLQKISIRFLVGTMLCRHMPNLAGVTGLIGKYAGVAPR